jgi:hypothetical protein
MTSRIRAVQVALHLPDAHAHEQGAVRDEVERGLVVAVMERVEARVHAALGRDAIVCLRHVALRWILGRDELRHDEVLDRLADELVGEVLTAVAALSPAERRRPTGSGIAVFSSAAHQRAVALADLADDHGPRWYHGEPLDGPAHWREVAAGASAPAVETVAILEALDRLEPALALADDATLAAIAAVAHAARPGAARLAARRAAATSPGRPDHVDPLVESDRAVTSERARVADATAATTMRPSVTAPTAPAAGDPSPIASTLAPGEVAPASGAPPAARAVADDAELATTSPSAGHPGAPAPPPAVPAGRARLEADVWTADTRGAGLFYLLGAALETDAAEALWAAGLPEGAVPGRGRARGARRRRRPGLALVRRQLRSTSATAHGRRLATRRGPRQDHPCARSAPGPARSGHHA